MTMEELRLDFMRQGRKGVHLIASSLVIWLAIGAVWTILPNKGSLRELLSLACAALTLPLSLLFAKIYGAAFIPRNNPLGRLNLLVSLNYLLYLLVAVWVYVEMPDKLVMVLAMILGAQMLPYAWLYGSKALGVGAVVIPLMALALAFTVAEAVPFVIPVAMIVVDIVLMFIQAAQADNLSNREWVVKRFGTEQA